MSYRHLHNLTLNMHRLPVSQAIEAWDHLAKEAQVVEVGGWLYLLSGGRCYATAEVPAWVDWERVFEADVQYAGNLVMQRPIHRLDQLPACTMIV